MNKPLKIILKASILIVLFLAVTISPPLALARQAPVPGDPAQLLGEPDGQDTFDSDNNWTLFDGDCFSSEIVDGKYAMTAKGIEDNSCWEVSWPSVQNSYLETVIQAPETCNDDDRFGLIFRAPDSSRGYLYGLTCDGRYSLSLYDGLTSLDLIRPTSNPAIQTGSGALNRLGVAAYGTHYLLYANGAFLQQGTDFTFTSPGLIGFFVRAASTQPFTVQFDDLKVWLLDEEYHPPQVPPPTLPPANLEKPPANVPSVTADVSVNVRSGPGIQFPVYGVASRGTSGIVVGLSPDSHWWAVKVPVSVSGNGIAWVSDEYVTFRNPTYAIVPTVQPPLLPSGIVVPPPPHGAPIVAFQEAAVIRSGPGPEYPVYGVSSVGAKVEAAGKSEDEQWWAIKLPEDYAPDGKGWVYADYVVTQDTRNVPVIPAPELPENVTPDAPGSGAPSAITLEPLNVHSGPGNEYTSYGQVPIGTISAVIGVSQDQEYWVIRLPLDIAPDGKGWVPARYTQATNTSQVPVLKSSSAPN